MSVSMTLTEEELDDWDRSTDPSPNRLLPPEERVKRGAISKWRRGADGSDVMPAMQREYLEEFLLKGKLAGMSKAEWCRTHNVSDRTVRKWERDERFIREWNRRLHQERLSPEFHDDIVKALRDTALDRSHPQHVNAASQLIKLLGMIAPPTMNLNVEVGPKLSDLSDDEVYALASRRMQQVELERGDDAYLED